MAVIVFTALWAFVVCYVTLSKLTGGESDLSASIEYWIAGGVEDLVNEAIEALSECNYSKVSVLLHQVRQSVISAHQMYNRAISDKKNKEPSASGRMKWLIIIVSICMLIGVMPHVGFTSDSRCTAGSLCITTFYMTFEKAGELYGVGINFAKKSKTRETIVFSRAPQWEESPASPTPPLIITYTDVYEKDNHRKIATELQRNNSVGFFSILNRPPPTNGTPFGGKQAVPYIWKVQSSRLNTVVVAPNARNHHHQHDNFNDRQKVFMNRFIEFLIPERSKAQYVHKQHVNSEYVLTQYYWLLELLVNYFEF